jgi:dipicolinate synthase subunit B
LCEVEEISGHKPILSIVEAEPIGPKKMFDILVVCPCTGNTLAKLNYGITDTSVTMAVKAHVRNNRPIVIAVATNDALSASAKNIGALLNRKNYYFVPFSQDDPLTKERSAIADFNLLEPTIISALDLRQYTPIIK